MWKEDVNGSVAEEIEAMLTILWCGGEGSRVMPSDAEESLRRYCGDRRRATYPGRGLLAHPPWPAR